ncbi:MAG: non-ribosomal peptide synthetase [Saccharofermentans sp.]|nr:non-ribosomal peptide synthetase [Saccharofermentans sp.]
MVSKIVTNNIAALKNAPQTFESYYSIVKGSFTSEVFGEWLENGEICTMSYYELYERVDHFSNASLAYASVLGSESKVVGIFLENSPDWVALFWGLLQAGFKPLLLNTRHNVKINNDIIKEMNPAFVVSEDSRIDKAITVKDLLESGKSSKFNKSMINWADEIILVTSGSTSKPKIISHNGKTICLQVEMSGDIVKENQSIQYNAKLDIHNLAFLPFYHVFGLIATLMWFMFFGRTFVFLPKYDAQSIQFISKRIGVTHFFAIPLVWNKIVENLEREVEKQGHTKKFNKAIKFSNKLQNALPLLGPIIVRKIIFKKIRRQLLGEKLSFLISGGGFINQRTLEVLNGIGYSIYAGYGLTECGVLCVELSRKSKYRCGTSTGKIFSNIHYKISEKGELLIPKDHSMNGIYKDGMFCDFTEDFYPTNDLVSIDETGRLHIIGRLDDVIIGPNGENISPEEIESRIDKGSFTQEAMIYCQLPGADEKQMVLVLADDGSMGAFEKASSLRNVFNTIDTLTMSERPQKVINLIGLMPENFKGIDRKSLARKLESQELFATECVRPTEEEVTRTRTTEYTELIAKICDVYADILNKDRSEITETSNFVSLGGDSMQYVELLAKVSEVTEREISMTETPLITPMAIADYLIDKNKEIK